MPAPDITVIIPVYNEEQGVGKCYRRVSEILRNSPYSFEIIFIDDGSTDSSFEKMLEIQSKDDCVRLIQFKRNFGQQPALMQGLKKSRGRAVITYDADLQFVPECIPELAEKIFQGYDIASGIRIERKDPLFYNRIPSALGRYLINTALKIRQKDFGSVKAYSKALVKDIVDFPQNNIIIPALAYHLNKNFIEIPVRHQARETGQSKWTVFNRIRACFLIYLMYARKPFYGLLLFSLMCLFSGIPLCLFAIWQYTQENSCNLIYLTVAMVMLCTGCIFLATSLTGGFMARMMRQASLVQENPIKKIYQSTE